MIGGFAIPLLIISTGYTYEPKVTEVAGGGRHGRHTRQQLRPEGLASSKGLNQAFLALTLHNTITHEDEEGQRPSGTRAVIQETKCPGGRV